MAHYDYFWTLLQQNLRTFLMRPFTFSTPAKKNRPDMTSAVYGGHKQQIKLDLMFMKHYAPNRCLYIKVAKLRTGVGSTETSYLQNCSVKLFKEHFKVQICKGRLFEKNKITFFLIFTN